MITNNPPSRGLTTANSNLQFVQLCPLLSPLTTCLFNFEYAMSDTEADLELSTPNSAATPQIPHNSPPTNSPDNFLPPVEPPSAGLLLQLFVIPGVIVAIIVAMYWGVNRLAHGQADPHAEVEKIIRKNNGSWQAASNLADQLRNPNDQQIRRNAELAKRLIGVLQDEIKAGRQEKEDIALRYFLCRTLGEFELPVVVPVLVQAAKTERDKAEVEVRLAALEALTLHLAHATPSGHPDHPEIVPTLLAASRDTANPVRSRATFALGVVKDPDNSLTARLVQLLDDPYPDVRFNAATQLARQGEVQALPILAEMLSPDPAALQDEEKELRESKRQLIVVNGLRAISSLIKAQPTTDLSHLLPQLSKLHQDSAASIRMESQKLSQQLKTPQPAAL